MFDPAHIPEMTDEELRRYLVTCEPGSRFYIIIADELTRRYLRTAGEAGRDLSTSSGRVERLTWVLIVLTAILLILAVPPAWDAATKLLGR
ncbi:MAG: hypothetical protein ACXWN1_10265 [Thermoanaerobaculia bacterium]